MTYWCPSLALELAPTRTLAGAVFLRKITSSSRAAQITRVVSLPIKTTLDTTSLSHHPEYQNIMATTVHVKNISTQTTEKEVRDFFSFW